MFGQPTLDQPTLSNSVVGTALSSNVGGSKKKREKRGTNRKGGDDSSKCGNSSSGSSALTSKIDSLNPETEHLPASESQIDDSSTPDTAADAPTPLPCTVCTRLSTILPCCLSRKPTSSCLTCTAFDAAVAAQVPDAKTVRQIQEDRIESLKLATKDFEAEKERLKALLDEKKRELKGKIGQVETKVGRNAAKKIVRKLWNAGEKVAAAKEMEMGKK